MVSALDSFYASGRTRPIEWRLAQIESAIKMLTDHKDEWIGALEASALSKPAQEGELTEVIVVTKEARTMAANLKSWIAPIDVATPAALIPASSQVEKQPLGVTLVIGPFNYPLMLTLGPVLGAICAGCPVLVKPSELVPEVAELLAKYLPLYLDPSAVKVVTGGIPETSALLKLKWDNICFTVSERVGRIVAAAAAVHLTPTTLELGGKVSAARRAALRPKRALPSLGLALLLTLPRCSPYASAPSSSGPRMAQWPTLRRSWCGGACSTAVSRASRLSMCSRRATSWVRSARRW